MEKPDRPRTRSFVKKLEQRHGPIWKKVSEGIQIGQDMDQESMESLIRAHEAEVSTLRPYIGGTFF